jgi:hypothetical protein
MKRELIKPILIGIILAILLTCILAGFSLLIKDKLIPAGSYRAPVITKMSVPTVTSTSISPIIVLTETQSIQNGEIAVGIYVQITGTGSVGLRIRLSPGTDSTPQFIAKENEVFSIKDGPVEKDGITWWLLVASYDNNRQGWAAGQYLTVINQP